MKAHLPAYMVPVYLVKLSNFPLTESGKLNREMLPDPGLNIHDDYTAPRTTMEAEICEIWQEIMGRDRISIREDFFRTGGSSILAIKMINILKKRLKNHTVTIKDLFDNPSIETFSACLSSKESRQAVEQGEI
jgi:aryl carrier-like protein